MYDWPELQQAWDALWAATRMNLRSQGVETLERLRRGPAFQDEWTDPRLLLGQSCGWPFVSRLAGAVITIGRFDFGLRGAPPGHYYSVFISRRGGCRSLAEIGAALTRPLTRIAVNAEDSQSGFRAFGECLSAPTAVRRQALTITGSHRNSILAVAAGDADVAAIDAVSWRYATAFEPAAREVAVIARSAPVPGLPLIVSQELAQYGPAVAGALAAALAHLPAGERKLLGAGALVASDATDYAILARAPFGNFHCP
jgi:ABC-type phosphate/phosphonate transport system substrate-binding protein